MRRISFLRVARAEAAGSTRGSALSLLAGAGTGAGAGAGADLAAPAETISSSTASSSSSSSSFCPFACWFAFSFCVAAGSVAALSSSSVSCASSRSSLSRAAVAEVMASFHSCSLRWQAEMLECRTATSKSR